MFNFAKQVYAKTKVVLSNKTAFAKGAAVAGTLGAISTVGKVIVKTTLYTADSFIEIAKDIKNIISPKVETQVAEVQEGNSFVSKVTTKLSEAADIIATKWDSLVVDRPGRELSKDLADKHPYAKLALDVSSLATNLLDSFVLTTLDGAFSSTGASIETGYEYANFAKIEQEVALEAFVKSIEDQIIVLDETEFMEDPVSVADVDSITTLGDASFVELTEIV